jgi:hypothetical protein
MDALERARLEKVRDEPAFMRWWAERVWDRMQIAQIESLQDNLLSFAENAWRPIEIEPPSDVLLVCACEEGVVLMTRTQHDAWRTSEGKPHKPPRAWMPCPAPPPLNGRDRPG